MESLKGSQVDDDKRQMHYNGATYTFSLDRHQHWIDGAFPPVYWFYKTQRENEDGEIFNEGVLLTTYFITKDDDPSWRGTVRLAAPLDDDEPLCIVDVSIQADNLTTTALPIAQIRQCCLSVGGVMGKRKMMKTETNGKRISVPYQQIVMDDGDVPIHPAELKTLLGDEAGALTNEMKRRLYEAEQEYLRLNANKDDPFRPTNKKKFVSERTGRKPDNISREMKRAREHMEKLNLIEKDNTK